MDQAKPRRNIDLDFLKGIAIVAVVFYHIGLLPFGYLGVDLFFCLNGYFITRVICRGLRERDFNYPGFLRDRLVRLWPVLIVVIAVALIAGYLLMLPDDFENLGNSVVASTLMANNILANITIQDYWAVRNAYQPLMHTWYLGVLVQCYVVFPAIIYVAQRFTYKRLGQWCLWILLVGSVALYLCPEFSQNDKFYYLPFRLFEFLCGAMMAIYLPCFPGRGRPALPVNAWRSSLPINVAWWVVVAMLTASFLGAISLHNEWMVITVVALTVCALVIAVSPGFAPYRSPLLRYAVAAIAYIGAMSYSIYLWHQVVIAFYRYSISESTALLDIALIIGCTAVVALLTYYLVERPLSKPRTPSCRSRLFVLCAASAAVMVAIGLWVHMVSGVVRDVPELGITRGDTHSGMHSEYNDRIYGLDQPFDTTARVKVLIVGNSFARDMANVILESEHADAVDISYRFDPEPDSVLAERIQLADVILIQGYDNYERLIGTSHTPGVRGADAPHSQSTPHSTLEGRGEDAPHSQSTPAPVYLIGTKSYGISNGRVYIHRGSPNYWQLSERPDQDFLDEYKRELAHCPPERYLDFMSAVLNSDGTVRVFTPDSMYISQDCRHLTLAGAKFYTTVLKHQLDTALRPRR